MKIDKEYTYAEICSNGLSPKKVSNFNYKVFQKSEQIFFFEELKKNKLRLFSVINKNSFYLS